MEFFVQHSHHFIININMCLKSELRLYFLGSKMYHRIQEIAIYVYHKMYAFWNTLYTYVFWCKYASNVGGIHACKRGGALYALTATLIFICRLVINIVTKAQSTMPYALHRLFCLFSFLIDAVQPISVRTLIYEFLHIQARKCTYVASSVFLFYAMQMFDAR